MTVKQEDVILKMSQEKIPIRKMNTKKREILQRTIYHHTVHRKILLGVTKKRRKEQRE